MNLKISNIVRSIEVSLIGPSKVGKSTLLSTLAYDEYLEEEKTTRGRSNQSFKIKISDTLFEVIGKDFGGQLDYLSLVKEYSDNVDGILLCFDLCDPFSFWNLYNFIPNQSITIPVILVGLKSDLTQEVKDVEIIEFLEKNPEILGFYKVSSKSKENIYEPFKKIIRSHFRLQGVHEIETDGSLLLQNKTISEKTLRFICPAEECNGIITVKLGQKEAELA